MYHSCIIFLYFLALAQSVLVVDPVNGSDNGSGPFETIQGAIAYNSGSVLDIQLNPGLYEFNSTIAFSDSLSVVRLIATDPYNTQFQCTGSGYRALSFPGISSVELYGITISDCYETTSNTGGGALWANMGLSIKISKCQFYNNTGRKGGAVSIQSTSNPASQLTITDSIFANNNASNGGGGGLFITMFHSFISNCSFTNNNATAGGGGLNVYWEGTSVFPFNVTIQDSVVKGNIASTSGAGISAYNLVPALSLTVTNTTIADNTLYTSVASCQGVGIYFYAGVLLQLNNSTLSNNIGVSAGSVRCQGGGIYTAWLNGIGSLQVYSTELSGNYAYLSGGVMITTRSGRHLPNHYFVDSVFRNNTGSSSYGALLTNNCSVIIERSLFEGNHGPTNVVAQNGGTITLRSSIVRNHDKIGVSCESSNFVFYESSIYNNFQDFNCLSNCNITGTTEPLCSACSQHNLCSQCNGNTSITCAAQCDGYTWYSRADECPGVIPTITMSSMATTSSSLTTGTTSSDGSSTSGATSSVTSSGATTGSLSTSGSATTGTNQTNIGAAETKTSGTNGSNTTAIVIGVVVGGVALIIGVFLAFFLLKKRRTKREELPETEDTTHYAEMSQSHSVYSAINAVRKQSDANLRKTTTKRDKYEIFYQELVLQEQIGKGAYGIVFKALWRSSPVAVKKIKTEKIDPTKIQEFVDESKLMADLQPHKNVVQYLGCCQNPLCIVTELCEKGSLLTLLKTNADLTMEFKIKVMKDVAAGMLHLAKEGIVHRDLAARNVLLSEGNVAKVTDFGMSLATDDNSNKMAVGPLKWMSFEALENQKFSEYSDVWSYGVMCVEILTRKEPFPDVPLKEFADRVLVERLTCASAIPSDTPQFLSDMIKKCFAEDPKARPSFDDICITFLE